MSVACRARPWRESLRLPSCPHLRAEGFRMTDVDVVIVGAGCAGLAAAKRLRAAGLTFHVVEAMDRIGGRALTTTTDFGL
ncbi:MAG: NAD(P)-binding protein, partial [Pseudomonadota bacterium]